MKKGTFNITMVYPDSGESYYEEKEGYVGENFGVYKDYRDDFAVWFVIHLHSGLKLFTLSKKRDAVSFIDRLKSMSVNWEKVKGTNIDEDLKKDILELRREFQDKSA